MQKKEFLFITLGFCGVILIINPQILQVMNKNFHADDRNVTDQAQFPYYAVGVILAFLTAITLALATIIVRSLNIKTSLKTYYVSVFWSFIGFMVCVKSCPEVFAFWKIGRSDYPISLNQLYGYLVIGFF